MYIVGIGNTGCQLAKQLSTYPQYDIVEIDQGVNVDLQKSPEKYEENCPSFKKLFSKINDDVWVMFSASGMISGLSLRVLEQLKGKRLNVLCVLSDPSLLSTMGKLQQNLVKGVMQEYARSGLLEQLVLVDNAKVEDLLGEVAIDEYWNKLNEIITYTFHSVMCFHHNKPILEVKEEKPDIARITTIGLYDDQKNKKLFYDLKHIKSERYYYSFSKEDVKKNGKILPSIKKDLLSEDEISRTFAIYESEISDKYAYVESSTHIIAENV